MKKILALVAVATTLLLTGCSQVGSAATIGSTKISQATVQGSIDAILAARQGVDTSQMQLETGEVLNRGQLRFHLLTALLREVGKEIKLSVSKAEIDTRRQSIIDQVGGEEALPNALIGAGIARNDFDQYIEAILISDKITQALTAAGVTEADMGAQISKLVVAKAKELGVTVNPRYGKWDATVADVVASDAAGTAVTPTK
ncbi:MAG: hypothetical protein RL290_744 [Actinomycetota bacterium]